MKKRTMAVVDDVLADAVITSLESESPALKWSEEGVIDETVSVKFHEIEQHADNKILDELAGLGDTLEQMAWKIGWATDRLYRNLVANKCDVDYLFVCYYVAVTKLKNQRSMNTVKKWALTARFFPLKVARQYNYDILPMSHFMYAASFGNQIAVGERGIPILDNEGLPIYVYQMVLDWSWNEYCNSPVSRHVSVRELKDKFETGVERSKKPASSQSFSFTPLGSSSVTSILADDVVSHEVANATPDVIISIIKGVIDNFTMAASNYIPMLVKAKPEVGQALAGVVHNLEVIADRLGED